MAISHRIQPKYKTKNEAIVADIIEKSGARPPVDPYMKIKRLTAQIAVEMALIHGGEWRPSIDHEDGLIVVARRPAPRLS